MASRDGARVEVRVEDLPEEFREASENAPARTAGSSSEGASGDWTALLEELVSAKLAAGESGIWIELFPDFERTVIRTALNVLNGRRIELHSVWGLVATPSRERFRNWESRSEAGLRVLR